MTFGPIKSGGWGVNEKLTSTQMNEFQTNMEASLDGAGGSNGTPYTPTTQIEIGGEGNWNVELADLLADLKTIDTTSLPSGTRRAVAEFGAYELVKPAVYPEDIPLVIAPTTGTGRWVALDPDAKLAYEIDFTTSGTWVCPPNLTFALVEIVGGGGGGGAGANTTASTDDAPGGGGGGSGLRYFGLITPTPTTSYAVTVGAGGLGGVGGTSTGNDGGDSSIGSLASAKGGQGGSATVPNGGSVLVPGGAAGAATLGAPSAIAGTTTLFPTASQGAGGNTANGVASGQRGGSSSSFLGGAGGSHGTSSGGQKAGSGGGGGAAGPGGVGGAAGNGGNGNNSGAGTSGANGTAAAANTGAGGGGGGGAGAGSTGSATQGNGGNGASGQVTIRGYV